jgi:cytochrome c oxidase subunit 2
MMGGSPPARRLMVHSFDERHDVVSSQRPVRGARARLVAASAATAALLFLAGCSADTVGQLKRLGLPEAASDRAPAIGDLWIGSWIAAAIVGVFTWGLIGWAVVRYRSDHNEMPNQNRYNLPMEIFYTTAPFVIIGVLFYYTILAQNTVTARSAEPEVTVNVTAQKWSWVFNYKTADNPDVGEDVWEGGTIQQTPDLYLPVGKSVRFNLRAADVNHSFWVPAFYYKLDVIAGRNNNFEMTPTKEGVFRGKCAELCGTYHSAMLFNVHVVSEEEYEAHLRGLAEAGNIGEVRGPRDVDPQGDAAQYQGEEVGQR